METKAVVVVIILKKMERGKMEPVIKFWNNHCDRIIFMVLSLGLSFLLYWLEMREEAKVIFIGLAMLCYNKARGSNDKDDKIV